MLATMRLSSLLTLPPLLLPPAVHACRSNPLLTHLDALRPQSFPALALSNFASSSSSSSSFSSQSARLFGSGSATLLQQQGQQGQEQQGHEQGQGQQGQEQSQPPMDPSGSVPAARKENNNNNTTFFTYKVGASFCAKGRKFNAKSDRHTYNPPPGQEVLPLQQQSSAADQLPPAAIEEEIFTGRPMAGQDAFFISAVGSSSAAVALAGEGGKQKKKEKGVGRWDMAFGVADGVGGWADSGIDSADFSHGLCRAMALIAAGEGREEEEGGKKMKMVGVGPRELLEKAYRRVAESGEVEGGGSTACVAVGGGDGVVRVANLGDSGFLHLRPSAVHYASPPQTHAFNTPFQLSIVPPKMLQMSKMFGGSPLSDRPSEADVSSHEVKHGDVFVFATDGVWDNLPAEEVLVAVTRQMKLRHAWVDKAGKTEVGKGLRRETWKGDVGGCGGLQAELAAVIVQEAKAASLNTLRESPFGREMKKHYPAEGWRGGKVDDICVVVAVVVEEGGGRGAWGEAKL